MRAGAKIKKRVLYITVAKALVFALSCNFFSVSVRASSVETRRAAVMQCHTGEGSVSVYVDTDGEAVLSAESQIGRTAGRQVDIVPLSEKERPMRTLFLLDNSLSINEKYRPVIAEVIKGVIDGHLDNEELRIATIDTEAHYMSDYSSDYEELKRQVDSIDYINQSTYLTDILYYEIQKLQADTTDAYTRVVVISDGTDDMAVGITSSEVVDAANNSNIPVYAIGALYKNNEERLQNMFAISRRTNAQYYDLDQSDGGEIVSGLAKDRQMTEIVVYPEEEQLDGMTKSVKLTLSTSAGSAEVTADVRMPFGNIVEAPVIEEADDAQEEVLEETESEEEIVPELIDEEPESEETPEETSEEPKKQAAVPVDKILLALLAVLLVVALLYYQKKKGSNKEDKGAEDGKKNKKSKKSIAIPNKKALQDVPESGGADEDDDRTVIVEEPIEDIESVSGGIQGHGRGVIPAHHIIITDNINPGIERRFYTDRRIVIGRDADLNDLSYPQDKSISSQHCYIDTEQNGGLILVDLNSKNGVKCDGIVVNGQTPLRNGSVIMIGQTELNLRILD